MISVCYITKNEADWLGEAIDNVSDLAAEIVVYDTGSTDNTLAIAQAKGVKLSQGMWPGDFSTARNQSLALATQPWILRIDPDERLSTATKDKIRRFVLEAGSDIHALQCLTRNYTNSMDAMRDEGFQVCKSDTSENEWSRGYGGYIEMGYTRLFRRLPEIQFVGLVHEGVDPTVRGRIEKRMDIIFHHYGTDPAQIRKKEKRSQYKELLLKQTARKDSNWFDWQALGLEFLEDQNYEAAVPYFLGALHKTDFIPNRLQLLSNIAWCHLQREQLPQAEEHLSLALQLDSEHLSSLLNLADLSLRKQDPRSALKTLNQAVKSHPESALVWRALGQTFGILTDWQRSQNAFETALRLAPDFVDTHIDLAILLKHLNDHTAARARVNKALALDPQNTRALALVQTLTPSKAG